MAKTIKRTLGKYFYMMQDSMHYVKHKLSGSTYSDYYAKRQDRIVKRDPNWGLGTDKSFQLDFLVSTLNLKPENTFLDYGCGAINSGIHFIKYLNKGNYTGIDVSKESINQSKLRLKKYGLEDKNPTVLHFSPRDLSCIVGQKFDYIWANSVFTHMSPEDIEFVLMNLKNNLSENSAFYSTFCRNEKIEHFELRDWRYPLDFFETLCEKVGLKFTIIDNWKHPNDPEGKDTLAKFTL